MICPKCNSENVQVQTGGGKNPIMIGCVLALAGIGLMFLGIVGVAVGLILGLIIGAVLKAVMPAPVDTIAVCQNCGYSFNTSDVNFTKIDIKPLESGHTELLVNRESNSCGSAIALAVWLNDTPPSQLCNGGFVVLQAKAGDNILHYEQCKGLGKKSRQGSMTVKIAEGNRQRIRVVFTPKGLSITED